MKRQFLVLLAAVSLGVASASAVVMQIPGFGQDIPKNGTGVSGGNGVSAADNFFRLQTVVGSLSGFPTPLSAGSVDISSNVATNLLGFEYAVLHYGTGNGGIQSSGGGVEIFFISGGESSFTFPAIGTGPNGLGAFSGGTLFNSNAVPGNIPAPGPSIPDSGSTLALLGAVFLGLAILRRKLA